MTQRGQKIQRIDDIWKGCA